MAVDAWDTGHQEEALIGEGPSSRREMKVQSSSRLIQAQYNPGSYDHLSCPTFQNGAKQHSARMITFSLNPKAGSYPYTLN